MRTPELCRDILGRAPCWATSKPPFSSSWVFCCSGLPTAAPEAVESSALRCTMAAESPLVSIMPPYVETSMEYGVPAASRTLTWESVSSCHPHRRCRRCSRSATALLVRQRRPRSLCRSRFPSYRGASARPGKVCSGTRRLPGPADGCRWLVAGHPMPGWHPPCSVRTPRPDQRSRAGIEVIVVKEWAKFT